MSEAETTRKVTFRVCVGLAKVQSVKVCVYDPGIPDEPIKEIQCDFHRTFGFWSTLGTVTIPRKTLLYRYRIEPKKDSTWIGALKSVFTSEAQFIDEQGLRQLPGNIDFCRDIYQAREKIQQPESVADCLRTYLQALLNGATTRGSMKRMTLQLEHTWRSFDKGEEFLNNTAVETVLCRWMKENLSVCSQNPFQLVFLSVVYGKLAEPFNLHLSTFVVKKFEIKKMFQAFDNVQSDQLTGWSLSSLRVTSLQILEAMDKAHWVFAAAHFPFLFEPSKILELKTELSSFEPHPDFAEKVLIPRILEGYGDNDAKVIFKEMGKMYKTSDQAAKVADFIYKLSQPQEHTYALKSSKALPNPDLADTSRGDALEPTASSDAVDEEDDPWWEGDALLEEQEHDEGEHARDVVKTPSDDSSVRHYQAARYNEQVEVRFRLLVNDVQTSHANLILLDQDGKDVDKFWMEISEVRSMVSKSEWVFATVNVRLPKRKTCVYRYSLNKRMRESGKAYSFEIDETITRNVTPPEEVCDIFFTQHNLENEGERNNVESQAMLFYANMLLRNVYAYNLEQSLIQIEKKNFPPTNATRHYYKKVLRWIERKCFPRCLPGERYPRRLAPPQRKFLVVIFGKILSAGFSVSEEIYEKCLYFFTETLHDCSEDDFPASTLSYVKTVCLFLAQENKESWLGIWINFCGCLDSETLVTACEGVLSPRLRDKTWQRDRTALLHVLGKLETDTDKLERFFECCIEHVDDHKVFQEVLKMCAANKADNSAITSKAARQLNDIINKRHFQMRLDELLELWKSFNQSHKQQIVEVIRQHIISFLCASEWDTTDNEMIQSIIHDRSLYSDSEEISDVMFHIVDHFPEGYACEMFIDVMQNAELANSISVKTTTELFTTAIERLTPCFRSTGKLNEPIHAVYRLLQVSRRSNHLSRYEHLSKQVDIKAYSIIKEVPLESLIDAMCHKKSTLHLEEICILAEHIKRRIHDDSAAAKEGTLILKRLLHVDGKLHVDTKPYSEVLVTLLDVQDPIMATFRKTNKPAKVEGAILEIIRSADFWLAIFQSEGQFSKNLQQHNRTKEAIDTLKHFAELLAQGNITIDFARQIKGRKEEVLLHLLLVSFGGADAKHRTQLKDLHELETQFQHKIDCLCALIGTCVDGLSHFVQLRNINELSSMLRHMQKVETQQCTFLKDTQQDDFWNCLTPLLPIALELQLVTSSIIFINVCRSVIKSSNADTLWGIQTLASSTPLEASGTVEGAQVNDDDEDETGVSHEATTQRPDGKMFTTMLKDVCLPVFVQYCQERIFSENSAVLISVVREMIHGITNENLLHAELDRLSRFFNKEVPPYQLDAVRSLVLFPGFSERLRQLEQMLQTFKTKQEADDDIYQAVNVINIFKILSEKDQESTVTLGQLHEALKTVTVFQKELKEHDWDIIEQLSESQELVSFLFPLVDEDLRNLIDAVEERSEQQVNESTVSDLIDVKRYLEPLLRLTESSAVDLVQAIKDRSSTRDVKHVASKINTCQHNVHSLQDLYNNVANRGEMTKEIVKNALESGVYEFKMDTSVAHCKVVLKYSRGTSEAIYGLEQLNDLRSRALLLANSQEQVPELTTENDTLASTPLYRDFVKSVDLINDIVQLSSKLVHSGHFSFIDFKENADSIEKLAGICTRLQRQVQHWKYALGDAREKHYFLNFFHSKQLWILDNFFSGECSMSFELYLLFKLIDIGIEADDSFKDYYVLPNERSSITARLFHLGEALERIANSHTLINRRIPGEIKSTKLTVDTKVIRGSLFVAELEKDSSKSIPVLLRLYFNTTGFLPDASQVVFCHANTSWEEIELLLKRCIDAPKFFDRDKLYSLVNVELLSTEVQFQLVKMLKDMQKAHDDFLLCLICRGGSYHHIIDQFSPQFTHRPQGLSDFEMNSCLRIGWPTVEVVTSSEPGLGKTEYIKKKANESNLGVSTLPISGPIDKDSLVRLVQCQTIPPYQVLHLDVAQLSDPGLFDSFLFELIVIGMAVSGTHLCMLPVMNIAIEVANMHHDKLRNALSITNSFNRTHLKWSGFSNFVVSEDPNSPVQVVCHYLRALGNKSIDTEDISLVGQNQVSSLPSDECRHLLSNLFANSNVLSYTLVDAFLAVLAQELRRMSASLYFTTKNLTDMLGGSGNNVRSNFVNALIDVSRDFTSRAVKQKSFDINSQDQASEALHVYRSSASISADQMVARIQGMVRWAESNHLLLVFHRQDSQTVSALYRMLRNVPINISRLFETQMKNSLRNYQHLSQLELQAILEKIVRSTRTPFETEKLEELNNSYALTPDNLLKMVLIHMRIKARIPVIVMGETGCGKTTLITYLARVCEVSFDVLNLHAGTSEDDINRFVISLIHQAEGNMNLEHWGFLDEINTCDHLGLLNDILCHRSFQGVPLPMNLFFLGACNPYRLREHEILSAGLGGKQRPDELSKLVYRVHPLPETMMDYVWDYGALDKKDEEAYIRRMLEGRDATFVDMVIMSQEFIRTTQKTSYCVSLRDVNRCQHLEKWFMKMYQRRKPPPLSGRQKYCKDPKIRSDILALTHCYYSRLTTPESRIQYKEKLASILQNKKNWHITGDNIEEMIQAEQMYFLNRMKLPEGTAKNEALRENVFVILVSILNRIPVFVVGMPGCSKSLSMQLIRSELKGPDSKDPFFKGLPSLYVVSYQGSESSTSEGITKVFEKAVNYRKHNKPDVMPVVLLDEIGLAEVSSFNPLKVLHSLLEPNVGGFPSIAVVGISNWALDAAKMNRAIHLSRPEPSLTDLETTAMSIRDESSRKHTSTEYAMPYAVSAKKLHGLAEAYSVYQRKQKHQNFHGLRDYYSLVKHIAMNTSSQPHEDHGDIIAKGILRNFGGLKLETHTIMDIFTEKMNIARTTGKESSMLELIEDNLNDRHARHLMLITSGDSALDILRRTLHDRDHVVIFGSHFENDNSEEYNYKILSEIILCMERGVTLVLRDLESIYGSLYDMLNQNYTWVGRKRNCRVALGPYSNPMCQVHDEFRCIVLVDENKVDYQNPPFLNRFEKQTLRFSDVLTKNQTEAIEYLDRWVADISTVEGHQFSRDQVFLGIHDETLPSLVYWKTCMTDESELPPQELASKCQHELLKVACPDAILRASKSKLAESNRTLVTKSQRMYFELPQQGGFKHFLEEQLGSVRLQANTDSNVDPTNAVSAKIVIYTHSTIHVDIKKCLADFVEAQVEKLSSFKSEQSFVSQIRHFWFESSAQLLVLQCMTSLDAATMLLAKCRIDQCRKEYLASSTTGSVLKHVCMIVHIDRGQRSQQSSQHSWQLNFLSGWSQYTLDSLLEASSPSLDEILQRPLSDLFSGIIDMNSIIEDQLLWCFGCIQYEDKARTLDSAIHLAKSLSISSEFMGCLHFQILRHLRTSESRDSKIEVVGLAFDGWQVDVACTIDGIYGSCTLIEALMDYVKSCVRIPLAKTIILLESLGAWTGSPIDCTEDENEEVAAFWQTCFRNAQLFDIKSESIPHPRGVESCLVQCNFFRLKFPFFAIFHSKVSCHRDWLLSEDLNTDVFEEHLIAQNIANKLADIIGNITELQYENFIAYHVEDYLEDLYNTFSEDFALNIPEKVRFRVMKWAVDQVSPLTNTEADAIRVLANAYAVLWVYADLFLAQLQLLGIYQDVSGNELESLICRPQKPTKADERYLNEDKKREGRTENLIQQEDSVQSIQVEDDEYTDGCRLLPGTFKQEEMMEDIKDQRDVRETIGTDGDNLDNSGMKLQIQNQQDSPSTEIPKGPVPPTSPAHQSQEDLTVEEMEDKTAFDDDNEDVIDEENTSATTYQETPQTILVSEICRSILPVASTIERIGGKDEWQRKASRVILLAGRVSKESPGLHFLRLCRDFAVLLDEFDSTFQRLQILSEKGMHAENPFETEDVFEYVIDTMYEHMAQGCDSNRIRKLEEFLCQFFGVCLLVDLDTPFLPQIVHTLYKNTGELLSGARPVLLSLFEGEKLNSVDVNTSEFLSIYDHIIFADDLQDDAFGNLTLIDDILKESDRNSHLPILCCDIIEDIAFGYITCDLVDDIRSEEHQLVKAASEAFRIISDEQENGLKIVTAAAYLRSFFISCAALLKVSHLKSFQLDGDHSVLANILNSLIRTEDTIDRHHELPLKTYLLKCLRQNTSLYSLRKWCTDSANPLPILRGLTWQDKLFATRLGYNPMSYAEHYPEVLSAIADSQVRKDTSHLLSVIDKARSSAQHRLGLLAAVAELYYFVQTAAGLNDADKRHSKWLLEQTIGFPSVFIEFMKRLMGLRDFEAGLLQISDSTNEDTLNIVSVVIHLASRAIANVNHDTDLQLTSFTESKEHRIEPGICVPSPIIDHPGTRDIAYIDCVCGYRVIHRQEVSIQRCPVCKKAITQTQSTQKCGEHHQRNPNSTGMSFPEEQPYQHASSATRCTRDILTECSLLVKESLRHLNCSQMGLPQASSDGSFIANEAATSKDRDAEDVEDSYICGSSALKATERHWNELSEILRVTRENAAIFMQCVVRAINDANIDLNYPADDLSRQLTTIITRETQKVPNNIANLKRTCFERQGVTLDSIESELEEVDVSTPSTLAKLFRMRSTPSFVDFKARFVSTVNNQTSSYSLPFLQLYFLRHEELQYIRYLPAILKWNALVTSRLTNRIKRDDAKRYRVAEFLTDNRYFPDQETKVEASKCFKEFQNAWNGVRDGWRILMHEKPDFDRMTSQSTIVRCVVARNEPRNCMQSMISILQQVQNSFLMDAMAIATREHCPALNFVVEREGVGAIKHMPLRSAKRAIIEYSWSDEILQHHDISTEYGNEGLIDYKFYVIERELARTLVLNKAVLTEEWTISQFSYSDDLFHACSVVLAQLSTLIPQRRLSKELVINIAKEQDRHHTFAKEMLEHLEIILVLLKKTGGDPGCSIQDFVKRWSSHLPGHFPEDMLPPPNDEVKLQHVVHLYEILEDLLMDGVIESIHDEFRQKLPPGLEESLSKNLMTCNKEELTKLSSVIRRFVFRFLRSSHVIEAGANLKEVMTRSFGATSGRENQLDLIPEAASLGHVMKIIDYITIQVEKRENLARRKETTPIPTRATTSSRSNKKRRGGNVGGIS